MSNLLIGLLGALIATNQPAAVSNLIATNTGLSISIPDPNDPVEKEYQRLLEMDDAALEDVDRWIRDHTAFADTGAGVPDTAMNRRIDERLGGVRKAYESFLERHPTHARAYLAYGSFLNDAKDEAGAAEQWEKARQLDPANPAAWNNLANYYGHRSPVKKAFEYYAKASELAPTEPVYLWNLATTVYLFRKDAREHYGITEEEVFDKSLALYRKARSLDPDNFILASDYAQSYYGIKPMRVEAALDAWNHALKIARDDVERQGVFIHLARIKLNNGRFEEARRHLADVKLEMYASVKDRLLRNLTEKEDTAKADATVAQEAVR